MRSFITASKNTCDKIFGHRKYRVFFLIACVLAVFFSLYSKGGMRLSIGMMVFSFSNGAYLVLSMLTGVLLPLVIFMLCADLYAHEIADCTIKMELLRPIGRSKLYFAKFTGILAYCAIVLLTSFVISSAIGLINGSIGNIVVLLVANLMSLLLCCVYIALSSLIAVWTANASLTMFISILLYIVLNVASSLSSTLGAVLFTNYSGWYKMVIGSVIPWKNVTVSFGLLLSYAGVFASVGQLLFDRKDIA